MTEPKVSIIIPFYNHWDLTHARLMDLRNFAPDDSEIVLINDASTDIDCEKGIKWWKEHGSRHPIRYHRNETNLGFGGSHNNGAKLADGDILIFLSNDVKILGNIFTKIVDLVNNDDKILLGGRIVDWKAGWNQFISHGVEYVIPYAEGWLIACTKPAWKQLGGWDTRYGRFDYEDVDLSMNALVSGYNVVGLNSNQVQHLGGQTISSLGIDRLEITKKNREIFINKWEDSFYLIDESWISNDANDTKSYPKPTDNLIDN